MGIEEEIKQKKFRSEHHKMLINLMFTTNSIGAAQNKVFKPYGLSSQQYNILRILRGQHPKPAPLNLIQERMLDKNSNASRLVDKLILKKLVERKECLHDKRQVDIVITETGLELLKQLDGIIEKNEEFLTVLTDKEAKEMNRLLDKLRG